MEAGSARRGLEYYWRNENGVPQGRVVGAYILLNGLTDQTRLLENTLVITEMLREDLSQHLHNVYKR